jgi:hypothetical protein
VFHFANPHLIGVILSVVKFALKAKASAFNSASKSINVLAPKYSQTVFIALQISKSFT